MLLGPSFPPTTPLIPNDLIPYSYPGRPISVIRVILRHFQPTSNPDELPVVTPVGETGRIFQPPPSPSDPRFLQEQVYPRQSDYFHSNPG